MGKVIPGGKLQAFRSALLDHNVSVFIRWKPEYDLGIPIVDEQHRGIVTTINSLYYAMRNRHAEEILEPVISMVENYTRIHFSVEETFLEICDFSELKHHHGLHEELMARLSEVGQESAWNKDPYEFMHFLKEWWIDHICDKDRVFRDYIIRL